MRDGPRRRARVSKSCARQDRAQHSYIGDGARMGRKPALGRISEGRAWGRHCGPGLRQLKTEAHPYCSADVWLYISGCPSRARARDRCSTGVRRRTENVIFHKRNGTETPPSEFSGLRMRDGLPVKGNPLYQGGRSRACCGKLPPPLRVLLLTSLTCICRRRRVREAGPKGAHSGGYGGVFRGRCTCVR